MKTMKFQNRLGVLVPDLMLVGLVTAMSVLVAVPLLADTEVSGDQAGTWTRANSPYIVTGNITIPADQTLTIEPGVVVKFNDNLGIWVYGTLNANGTSASTITFTSNVDLVPDWWRCIQFHDGSSGTLDWCVIKYGGYWESTNILCLGDASPAISNSEISYCDYDGIRLEGTSSPSITNCTITDNGRDGIRMNDSACPTLTGNTITDNKEPVWITSGTAVPEFVDNTLTGNRWCDGIVYTGDIPDSTTVTWNIASVPYVIQDWLSIGKGAVLNIPAGMVVKIQDNQGIGVYGTLKALGTSSDKIFFTALTDDASDGRDTNRDGTEATPAGDYWRNIQFRNGSSGTLSHCKIYYGGYWENTNLIAWGDAAVTLSDCNIAYSDYDGVALHDSSRVTVLRSTIHDNGRHGIYLDDKADATLNNNTLEGNEGWAFYIHSWSAIPSASGNTVRGNVGNAFYLESNTIPEGQAVTWDMDPAVPYAAGSYTISSGASLTVVPTAVVKFSSHSGINVKSGGTLTAEGTASAPIVFTDLRDDAVGGDTNGDGSATTPSGDWWNSIHFQDGSSGALTYCTIRYGGYWENANIVCRGDASPTISHCTISHSDKDGIHTYDSAKPTLSHNVITKNGDAPIYVRNWGAIPTFEANVMTGNRVNAINTSNMSIPSWKDVTWNKASVPYWMGSVTVNTHATLHIPAGAIVKVNPHANISVEGTLDAVGTADAPVVFTAWTDDQFGGDSNCDGEETLPGGGYWNSIQFQDGSSGTLTHCIIRYGGYWENANIVCRGYASPTISYCDIALSDDDGIRVYDTAAPTISQCAIAYNGGYGIQNKGTGVVTATDNFWGTASGPRHESDNPLGTGNWVSDMVFFSPYLSTTPVAPLRSSSQVLISGARHLGNDPNEAWDVPDPEHYKLTTTFSLEEAPTGYAFIVLEAFNTDWNNTITVNGEQVGLVPKTGNTEFWLQLPMLFRASKLMAGENTLTIESELRGTDYDDFMVQNVRFYTSVGIGADTTPPVISDVTASDITDSSATITWMTDEISSSNVEYDTTTAYGLTAEGTDSVTSHSVSLTGLSASTTYHYRVGSMDVAGNGPTWSEDYTFTTKTTVEERATFLTEIPVAFILYQNYPNPFNPVTTIKYSLPRASEVSIIIYNMAGQKVATIGKKFQNPGWYSVHWDASGVGSGVYLYRIVAGEYSSVKKCLVIK